MASTGKPKIETLTPELLVKLGGTSNPKERMFYDRHKIIDLRCEEFQLEVILLAERALQDNPLTKQLGWDRRVARLNPGKLRTGVLL